MLCDFHLSQLLVSTLPLLLQGKEYDCTAKLTEFACGVHCD